MFKENSRYVVENDKNSSKTPPPSKKRNAHYDTARTRAKGAKGQKTWYSKIELPTQDTAAASHLLPAVVGVRDADRMVDGPSFGTRSRMCCGLYVILSHY